MKLSSHVMALGLTCSAMLFTVVAIILFVELPRRQAELLEGRGVALGDRLRRELVPMVLTDDFVGIDDAVHALHDSDPEVTYVCVLNEENRPIGSTFAKGVPGSILNLTHKERPSGISVASFRADGEPLLDIRLPFSHSDLGVVHVGLSRRGIEAYTWAMMLQLGLGLLVVVALTVAGAWWIGRRAGRPLGRLAKAARAVPSEFPDVNPEDFKEVAEVYQLAQAYHLMITALRASEKERDAYQRKLLVAERLATIGQLSAGIAHEINNPLDGVMEIARYLERSKSDPQKARKYLPRMFQGLRRIEGIVRSLLTFARQRTGPEEGAVEVGEAISEVLSLLERRLSDNTILVEKPDRYSCAGLASKVNPHLAQVLMNLLTNAIDAVPKNKGRIQLRVEAGTEHVRIMVEDNGPGVPPDKRENIFQPFFTTKEPGRGIGLGLAMSRNIIEQAGGELELCPHRSELGGARFIIELEKAQQHEDKPTPAGVHSYR